MNLKKKPKRAKSMWDSIILLFLSPSATKINETKK
jgi:hypothetical protein